MKTSRRIVAALVVAVLVSAVGAGLAWRYARSLWAGGSIDRVARHVPGDARAVLVGRGWIDLLYKAGSGFGSGAGTTDLRDLVRRLQEASGVGALPDPGDLRSFWVDPAPPAAVALVGPGEGLLEGSWLVLIPVRDEAAARAWALRAFPGPGGGAAAWERGPSGDVVRLAVGHPPTPAAAAVEGGWFRLAAGGSADPATLLERIPDGSESLWEVEEFRTLAESREEPWHGLLWLSSGARADGLERLSGVIPLARAPVRQAAGFATALPLLATLWFGGASTDLQVVQPIPANSPPARLLHGNRPGRPLLAPLDGTPMAVARLQVPPAPWLALLDKEAGPDPSSLFGGAAASVPGVDLRKDLLENLDGTLGFASLLPEGNEAQVATALWAGVRDAQRATRVLDGAFSGMASVLARDIDVAGSRFRELNLFGLRLRAGVVAGRVVLATGDDRWQGLAASFAGNRPGTLLASIPWKAGRAGLEGDAALAAWVSVAPVVRLAAAGGPWARAVDALPGAGDPQVLVTLGLDGETLHLGLSTSATLGDLARAVGATWKASPAGKRPGVPSGTGSMDAGAGGYAAREALANVNAIRSAQKARSAEGLGFLAPIGATPPRPPGARPAPFEGGGAAGFGQLGFRPGGSVRCAYGVEARDGPFGPDFLAWADCDPSGDGHIERYEASSLEPAHPVQDKIVR